MKIAMCMPSWPPGTDANGIVTYGSKIVPALRNLGHKVFVITPNAATRDPYTVDLRTHVRREPIWKRAKSRFLPRSEYQPLVSAVKRLVEVEQLDVLEIEESFGWSAAISRLDILPVVVRLHGPWFLTKTFEDTAREVREFSAIKAATFVTAPSRAVLNSVIDRCKLEGRRNAVVYNPLDPSPDQWSIDSCNRDSLLFVGRFDKLKGGDIVLRAFATLAENNQQLSLTFVGPDVGINGRKAADYAKDILSSDAFSRVTFTGPLPPSQIEQLRLQHFITVSASRFEVFGYTVLEAMASGCPVVAPNVGGIPELVTSGQDGILFEAGNVESLCAACQMLLDNRTLAAQYGSSGRKTCESTFGTKRSAICTTEFYRQSVETFQRHDEAHYQALNSER
jgi:glycosyltransferase involved in cell wall biosynthesis